MSLSNGMVKAALSGLHRKNVLTIFSGGRPRLYRFIKPEVFLPLASGRLSRIELKRERCLSLIYNCFIELDRMLDLTSMAVYSSVARGTASNNSDVDLLVVSQSLMRPELKLAKIVARRIKTVNGMGP
ncbi:MAG: nucleotidyltransferase domain-containing protein [Thermoproteota archaeon]